MYALFDTFNNKVVSRHRTIEAAVKADRRHQRAIKRMHGPASYIPTKIMQINQQGQFEPLPESDVEYMFHCYDWA